VLDDLIAPNLKIIFCGTAAGSISAERKQYYAGPGNKFWSIIHKVGLTPHQLSSRDYHDLLKYGLGLTDVVKGQSGNDSAIDFQQSDPASLTEKILKYQPSVLAFNGKKASQVFLGRKKIAFGLQVEVIGTTRLFVAPSTSGAANGYWDQDIWFELAALVEGNIT